MQVFITGDQCDGRQRPAERGQLHLRRRPSTPARSSPPRRPSKGVLSVTLTVFTRMDAPWVDGVAQGYLTMGRLDIPRCDNDPNHLDHGIFVLHMDGGK